MKKLLLLLFLFSAFTTTAQVSLGFTAPLPVFPAHGIRDSANSTVFSDTLLVKNYGTVDFYGYLIINTRVNAGKTDTTEYGFRSIPAGGSIPVPYEENYSKNNYIIGGNTVVIWPTAPGTPGVLVYDSLQYTIDLVGTSGISSEEKTGLRIYPNPATHTLYFDAEKTAPNIESAELLNSEGKLLNSYHGSAPIDMSAYPAGTYLLTIRLNDQSLQTYKIVKRIE